MTPPIPLAVLGGFLGAGKTTLLNHLLAASHGRRLAVLVNDFGAVNVDAALVASAGAESIELSNGCVCCAIGDDLTAALIRVMALPEPPEAIVIEASGVSDPWRIAQVSLADPGLQLAGVTVLVDAADFARHAADPLLADTLDRQLRAADLLLVNHLDRADAASRAALHAHLDATVPRTPRVETEHARVPLALMGLAPLPGDVQATLPPAAVRTVSGPLPFPGHARQFESCSLTVPGTLRASALRALLKAMPAGTLRLKGLVRTDEHGVAQVQFAGTHGSLRRAARPTDGEAVGAVVAIGLRDQLQSDAIRRALEATRAG